jgi:ABC-2 type transport system ATP-binding protein
VLAVREVRKAFDERQVLDGVDLTVEPGEIAALLGVNGAGKSTLLSIVIGLLAADSGAVTIGGHDVATHRAKAIRDVGIAPQETAVQRALDCRDNLRFYAELWGVPRSDVPAAIERSIEAMDLGAFADKPAQQLSGGERRRLHAAIAIVGRPRLLLLDEPTVGADVATRSRILQVVRDLAAEGTAVVYTTHYLAEVEDLGARVMILDGGRILVDDPLEVLLAEHANDTVELVFEGPAPAVSANGATVIVDGSVVRVSGDPIAALAAEVLGGLGEEARRLRGVEVLSSDLDSVFLTLTGRRYVAEEAS